MHMFLFYFPVNMTSTSRKLCKSILNEVFGELVASIGDKLHQWSGQTLQQLMLPPRIEKSKECLAVLIHHNLVTFQECPRSGKVIYTLSEDRVISLIKFPRYLVMCKTLFSDEGELIVEELFKLGQCSMSTVIFRAAKRMKMAKKDEVGFSVKTLVKSLRNKFTELVDCQFLCRAPSPYLNKNEPDPPMKTLPEVVMTEQFMFSIPDINFKTIGKGNSKKMAARFKNLVKWQ